MIELLSNLFTTANSWEASKHSLELDNSEVLYEAIYSAKINDAKVIIVLNTFVDYRFVHVSISGRNFVTKYLRFDLSSRDTFASMLTAKALHILNEINELQSRESVITK